MCISRTGNEKGVRMHFWIGRRSRDLETPIRTGRCPPGPKGCGKGTWQAVQSMSGRGTAGRGTSERGHERRVCNPQQDSTLRPHRMFAVRPLGLHTAHALCTTERWCLAFRGAVGHMGPTIADLSPVFALLLPLPTAPAPGMHWKGGGGASRARSPCPATVSLTPSASLNGICNRQ